MRIGELCYIIWEKRICDGEGLLNQCGQCMFYNLNGEYSQYMQDFEMEQKIKKLGL